MIKDALQNDPQAKEGLYWGRTYNRHNDMETYYLAINKIGMQSDSNTELMNIVYNEIANCAEADITKISSPSPEMGN